MRKKIGLLLFVGSCLLFCLIPSVCMTFARTDVTTENKTLAKLPALFEDGKWNTDVLSELGVYFEDHFAFRQQLVSADAEIQSNIFHVSNADTVIRGENGWLYYTATLDDYLGRNVMTGREAHNIAHNLALIQQYVQGQGAEFLFTVAPNKNTLYGENMPYYAKHTVSGERNCEKLAPCMAEEGIRYLDLFALFREQDETLYLKRDSHWNNKGARMVYNAVMDALQKEHETYSTTEALRTKTEYGDLNRMLYPVTAEPEWNYEYRYDTDWSYATDTESVEEAWIQTENRKAGKNLLMYRDSFGNTLLPFFANAFAQASFSRSVQYDLAAEMETAAPDYVVVEKVERNIRELETDPPVIPAVAVELKGEPEIAETASTIRLKRSETNTGYWELSGRADPSAVQEDTVFYISVTTEDGETTVYEAFSTAEEESDCGYEVYLPEESLAGESIKVAVLAKTGEELRTICEKTAAPEE